MAAQGKIGQGSAGQKKGLFKNSVNVSMLGFLPGISQIRTFLKVYGAELRLLLKKNITDQSRSSSSLVAAPRVGFEYTFPLAPPFPPRPLPSCLTFPLPVSLSFGCPRRSRVVCGGTVKPVCLSSLEVLQTWSARGEASVNARGTEHALGHERCMF